MKRKQMMNLKSAYDDFCPFDTESTLQWLWTRKLEAYWKQELYKELKKLDDPSNCAIDPSRLPLQQRQLDFTRKSSWKVNDTFHSYSSLGVANDV
jgi:hypothetical protein